MELIRGLQNLRRSLKGSVVTIGSYDGLHVGHQALLGRLRGHAARLSRPAMMLTFEPTPREFFATGSPPTRLTSFRERFRLLERMGLDALCLLCFDERLRNMSGQEFANLLGQELVTPQVVVGHDFRFGRGGEATAAALSQAGARMGFEVEVVQPVTVKGLRVSSTGVREALGRGDLALARELLGRPYSMIGRVVAGERLGRKLGYPTANLRLKRQRPPVEGIFAARVHGVADEALPAVASLGTRPAVGGTVPLLEAHVFDFSGDLYGREIEVEFVAKLRDERHFVTLDALVEQMNLDAGEARRILTEANG
jgi:riboflavin kinase/FMN adenylyltransferase